jgi:hypothetical protein
MLLIKKFHFRCFFIIYSNKHKNITLVFSTLSIGVINFECVSLVAIFLLFIVNMVVDSCSIAFILSMIK